MKNVTRIQRLTLALVIGAIIWEVAVRIWARSLPDHDPLIRADLVVIIPVLAIFITLSIFQFLRSKGILLLLFLPLIVGSCKKQEGSAPASASPNSLERSIENQGDAQSDSLKMKSERVFKTKTGKTIQVKIETSDSGLINVSVIPVDFEFSKEPFELKEIDPLTHSFTTDLDGNGFEELYLVTKAAGSGSYGGIYGFASNGDKSLTPIYVPEASEQDYEKEGMLFGYMGHDSIFLDQGRLKRKFPIYLEGDPNCCPTGGQRILTYTLVPGEATWLLKPEIYSAD